MQDDVPMNIEIFKSPTFQHVWLVLSHDQCLVSILLPDVLNHYTYIADTAIIYLRTSNVNYIQITCITSDFDLLTPCLHVGKILLCFEVLDIYCLRRHCTNHFMNSLFQ